MDTEMRAADLPPYRTLAKEHRLIERGLDLLGRFCSEIRRTGKLDASVANQFLVFIREFADLTHHLKEERILFPAIEAKGFFPGCGLVSEHELARQRVRAMADAVERSSPGDGDALRVFVQQGRSYINLLRSHIEKEDDCLANVTARTFSGAERDDLEKQFDAMEKRELGERVFERYAAILDALETRVGVGGQ